MVGRRARAFDLGPPDQLRRPLVSVKDGRQLTVRFVPGRRGPDLLWMVELSADMDATPLQDLGLSAREAEVLWLLTRGQQTKQIAHTLGISTGTVKKHLEHVYRKLGVSSATGAAAQAFDASRLGRDLPVGADTAVPEARRHGVESAPCGCSSVGRASASQAEGRGFDPVARFTSQGW